MILVGRHAAWYSRLSRFALRWLYHAAAGRVAAELPDGARVLDVGTGPGGLLVELARLRGGIHVVGIDPSADMVDHATRRLAKAGLTGRAEARLGTAENLPFPDESFDAIVSTLSSHHWAEPDAAIADQARVLRPGGRLWVFDLRGLAPGSVATALDEYFPNGTISRPHIGRITGALVVCHRAVRPAFDTS